MDDLKVVEKAFQKYADNLGKWLPEGLIEVDLPLLQRFGLIDYQPTQENLENETSLTRYFHVIETHEKITLINDQFIVWIVPDKVDEIPITYTLIALNEGNNPTLEMAFTTSGVYNSSHLVLRVLEKFLGEIQENEELISKFEKGSGF